MDRTLETELMEDPVQVEAYHKADFSNPHGQRVQLFEERRPSGNIRGTILDLGCGSGDIIFRFAKAFPDYNFVAIDGSSAMLDLGRSELSGKPDISDRIQFLQAFLPEDPIPEREYAVLMSHGFLHHLPDPMVLWNTLKRHSFPGSFIFIADLRRPASSDDARQIVEETAKGEPEILKRDFYNSLCAAFTYREIQQQLEDADMTWLKIEEIGDRHILIYGVAR